jgi:hypothetical protein
MGKDCQTKDFRMLKIKFNSNHNGEHHSCESSRVGDWIIFRCPKCPEFERRWNRRTGEMKSEGTKTDVHHSGSYYRNGNHEALENVN